MLTIHIPTNSTTATLQAPDRTTSVPLAVAADRVVEYLVRPTIEMWEAHAPDAPTTGPGITIEVDSVEGFQGLMLALETMVARMAEHEGSTR